MKRRIGSIYEMGIDLTNQGKDSYLGKSHAKSTARKTGRELYDEILSMIKALRWQDLSIVHTSTYYIVLPQPILDKIAQFRQVNLDLAVKIGKWYPLDSPEGVHMNVDNGTNRSHFPGGIPDSMRGLGLGYKCYRRLLEYKHWLTSNTSGTSEKDNAWASMIKKRPDPDDVLAIVGPGNVLAMIKTLPDNQKVEIATNFIQNILLPNVGSLTDTNFAIDDELKPLLPRDLLQRLDPTPRMELKRQREEENAREARRRTEAERAQIEALYPRFGISQIKHDFRPGEFVIRYSILNNEYAKPKIVARIGNELKAISVRNYIELSQNINYRPNEVRNLDETWTNISIDAIPDLNQVRLDDIEVAYIRNILQSHQTSAPAPHTDQARELAVRTLRGMETQAENVNYGPAITVYDQAGYYTVIHNRLLREQSAQKIKQSGFIKEIYMTQAQYSRYTQGKSSEVFVGFNGTPTHMLLTQHATPQKAINTLTGFVLEQPDRKGFAAKFKPIELRSKTELRQGDMVYIASHPEYYGLTGRVGYLTRHATTRQEFASIIIFNPALREEQYRRVTIPISFLRKLRIIA